MLTYRRKVHGGLNCIVAEDAAQPAQDIAAVFLHGFGASGEDLVPLAEELVLREPSLESRVKFVFPAAPLEPPEFAEFGGRAWWPIDMAALQRAAMLGEFRDLRRDCPPLLSVVRQHLTDLIGEIRSETGWGVDRFVLGGFSQGSMAATDVTLRLDESPAGLVIWSGSLLCEDEWRPLAPRRAGLPVVQSHGRQDSILPFAAGEWLRDLLKEAGLRVDFHAFNGPHTIPPGAVDAAARLVACVPTLE
jgi:phospholipase/carboxylesterase